MAIAILAASAAHSVSVGRLMSRRDAENALLEVGDEFRRALAAHAAGAHSDTEQLPRSLDELQRDPRVPGVVRYLRRTRADPLTGRSEWGLVRRADGAIVGVYSLAEGQPIKREGFDQQHRGFERAQSYSQWVFSPWPDQVARYRQ